MAESQVSRAQLAKLVAIRFGLSFAVLAAVFSRVGGYQTPEAFTHGMTVAVYIGGSIVALGALAATLANRRPKRLELALEGAA